MKVRFDFAMDDKGYVEIDDDKFDIDGWVDLTMCRPDDATFSAEVHILDLHRALAPFLQKHWENTEKDKSL